MRQAGLAPCAGYKKAPAVETGADRERRVIASYDQSRRRPNVLVLRFAADAELTRQRCTLLPNPRISPISKSGQIA